MPFQPKIQTQNFVALSSLFEGLPLAQQAYDESDHGSFDFSFGDAERTLVYPYRIAENIEVNKEPGIEVNKEPGEDETEKQWNEFVARLDALPGDCLVDVEN